MPNIQVNSFERKTYAQAAREIDERIIDIVLYEPDTYHPSYYCIFKLKFNSTLLFQHFECDCLEDFKTKTKNNIKKVTESYAKLFNVNLQEENTRFISNQLRLHYHYLNHHRFKGAGTRVYGIIQKAIGNNNPASDVFFELTQENNPIVNKIFNCSFHIQ